MSMNENKRPLLLSILCVFAFLGVIASLIYFPRVISSPELYISILFVLASSIGVIGIWKMKRWGLYLYVVSVLVGSIYGSARIQVLIFPVILIIVTLFSFRKMK